MKKYRFRYRFLSASLVFLLLIQIVGCSRGDTKETEKVSVEKMEAEEVFNYSFDAIGGSDVMPIMAFYGPATTAHSYNGNSAPNYYTEEFMELIAGTGINVISFNSTKYENHPHLVQTMLENAAKHDVGVIVYDTRINNNTSIEKIDEYINDYSNYRAYCGVFVRDEPYHKEYKPTDNANSYVEDFANVFTNLRELGEFGFGNLFPMGVGTSNDSYGKYVEDYLKLCNPQFLGYDLYPFADENGLKTADEYFNNMFLVREAAAENGIPFMPFVQCGSQWNDSMAHFDTEGYYPQKGQFMWSAGTALACGAKGIQYFTLIQPYYYAYSLTEPYDFQRNGLIGAFGNKTRWYYYAQEMNAQIAAVDHVLMNSVSKGVIASSETVKSNMGTAVKYLMDGTAWRELKDVSGDALVGCFNYQGKTALYVVNYDMKYAQHITLDFVDTYNVTVIQDAEEKHVSEDALTLTLSAGNSALVIFE